MWFWCGCFMTYDNNSSYLTLSAPITINYLLTVVSSTFCFSFSFFFFRSTSNEDSCPLSNFEFISVLIENCDISALFSLKSGSGWIVGSITATGVAILVGIWITRPFAGEATGVGVGVGIIAAFTTGTGGSGSTNVICSGCFCGCC
jgi:hypothetical protein